MQEVEKSNPKYSNNGAMQELEKKCLANLKLFDDKKISAKFRRKVLDNDIQSRLKELILEKQDEYLYEILEMETQPEHVHLLVEIPTRLSVDKL